MEQSFKVEIFKFIYLWISSIHVCEDAKRIMRIELFIENYAKFFVFTKELMSRHFFKNILNKKLL